MLGRTSWVLGGPVFLATAVAWAGSLTAVIVRHSAARILRPLVYLALLFFVLAAIFDILPQSKQGLSWPVFVAAVSVGYGTFWLVGTYVAPICPACAMRQFEDGHDHTHGNGLIFLGLALGVHCFLDGLGVTAASSVQAAFGLRVFGAITVHKLPEGFALALMLMAGGRAPWAAFVWAVGIETATLGGAIAGRFWTHPSEFWLSVVLAHIGGTFLYLSVSGLQDALSSRPARTLTAFQSSRT
jgi:zinc transporter ZupT